MKKAEENLFIISLLASTKIFYFIMYSKETEYIWYEEERNMSKHLRVILII
jgi:hypothetical protein